MIDRLRVDASSAIRALRRSPGTLTAALVMLAMAAGINLAMFGLIDRAILGPPAHVPDPARVFTIAFEHDVDGERVHPLGHRLGIAVDRRLLAEHWLELGGRQRVGVEGAEALAQQDRVLGYHDWHEGSTLIT